MWDILLRLLYVVTAINCCRFGPGPNCGFPCICTGDNRCDPVTGECSQGSKCQNTVPDNYNRSGPGCIIGNVAYGKESVHQSGQWKHNAAQLAVDGDTAPMLQQDSCAHPSTSQNKYAWWWVDLGGVFSIRKIDIVNRVTYDDKATEFAKRSTDYDINIGNTSDRSQQTLCFHQDKQWSEVQPVETILCEKGDMIGRYVSFTRTGGEDPNTATICEFIVMAHRVIECSSDCNGNCDIGTGCDECKPGKMLPDCKQDCPPGFWGVNCVNRCGRCKDGLPCDAVTGICGKQCHEGYTPEICSPVIGCPPTTWNLTVKNITANSTILVWQRSGGLCDEKWPYFYYIVRYGANDTVLHNWLESDRLYFSDVNGLSFQYILNNLGYNTLYNVQIVSYGEFNGLTYEGCEVTSEFKTHCIAPTEPVIMSAMGSIEVFKVYWERTEMFLDIGVNGSCDSLDRLQASIECLNSTHTMNETIDLPLSATEFFYSAESASECDIWLIVTYEEGLSTASDTVTISMGRDMESMGVREQKPSVLSAVKEHDNIPALVVGGIAIVLVLGVITIVIVLVLRSRYIHRNISEDYQHVGISGFASGIPNPLFDNIDAAAEGAENNTEFEDVVTSGGNSTQPARKK